MGLTLESIYKPVNDFFFNKYKTDTDSPIFFRFDKFGSVIADDDFTDPAEAQETFSDLTNRMVVLDPNGMDVFFGADLIDTEYWRLSQGSIPFADRSDPNKEAIIDAFVKIKAEANREWERLSTPRGGGIPDSYRASFASPSNWHDRTNNEIWTRQAFEVSENVSAPPGASPGSQLWKLRLDDARLKSILPALATPEPRPIELRRQVLTRKPAFARPGAAPAIIRDHRTRRPLAVPAAVSPRVIVHPAARPQVMVPGPRGGLQLLAARHLMASPQVSIDTGVASGSEVSVVRDNLRTGLRRLELTHRLAVVHYIRENAPTQPTTTNSLKISFDYCGVGIRRPWLLDALTKSKSWFIPGSAKGQETAPNSGVNLSVLPIGFIAIKNLSIEANWSQLDIDVSKQATDFGPFEVRSEIIDNKLSHDGLQIVGWLLQQMPALPPNDPPGNA